MKIKEDFGTRNEAVNYLRLRGWYSVKDPVFDCVMASENVGTKRMILQDGTSRRWVILPF